MAALLASLVAAFLCTWGDRTQFLAATLTAGTRRPGQVLAGLVLAAAASNAVAAFAGAWIAASINLRALSLLTALALLFAGLSGFIPRKQQPERTPRLLLVSTFILCLAAEMGDRIQFLDLRLRRPFRQRPAGGDWRDNRPGRGLRAGGDARRAAPGEGAGARPALGSRGSDAGRGLHRRREGAATGLSPSRRHCGRGTNCATPGS